MTRAIINTRRPNVTMQADWQGHQITVTVGFDPSTGEPCEVFADTINGGNMADTIKDACTWASLLLQHGCADIGRSLATVMEYTGAETAASPLGVIAECVGRART